ncbi:LexA family protein [Desulfoplanes sp. PS50]
MSEANLRNCRRLLTGRDFNPSEILFIRFLDLMDIRSYIFMSLIVSLSPTKQGIHMGRRKEREITPLQQETLDEICRYVSAKGYPPTIKELSDKFGISHASIHDRINQLVRKGFLQREDRKARSIVVVRNPRTDLKGK